MNEAKKDFRIIDKYVGTELRNEIGTFLAGAYKTLWNGEVKNHLILYTGIDHPTPVRVQSGCLTGDIFGDQRCDCHSQLVQVMKYIYDVNNGVLVYTVEDDGRGRGTLTKFKVYHLRDKFGITSQDACKLLGLNYDTRDYYPVTRILMDLGLERIILLSDNATKKESLEKHGIVVTDVKNIFQKKAI